MLGVGGSFLAFPGMSAPSQWFLRKRGLALGIAMSGSGIGGLAIAPVTQKLLDTVGLQWSLRITGCYSFVILACASILLKPRITPKLNASSRMDWMIFKDLRFNLLLLAGIFTTFGYLIPFFYLPSVIIFF